MDNEINKIDINIENLLKSNYNDNYLISGKRAYDLYIKKYKSTISDNKKNLDWFIIVSSNFFNNFKLNLTKILRSLNIIIFNYTEDSYNYKDSTIHKYNIYGNNILIKTIIIEVCFYNSNISFSDYNEFNSLKYITLNNWLQLNVFNSNIYTYDIFENYLYEIGDIININTDNITDEYKEILMKKCHNKNNVGNIDILDNVIYNCVNKNIVNSIYKYNKVDYVYNLYSLTHLHSDKYKMDIYLFGDYHNITGNKCKGKENKLNVDQFIINQIEHPNNQNKIIDIFIEIDPQTKDTSIDKYNKITYMTKLAQKLGKCIEYNKKECKYKNIRAHYTDIRTPFTIYSMIQDIYYFLKWININNNEQLNMCKQKIFNFFNFLKNKNNIIFLYDINSNIDSNIKLWKLLKYTKIQKQLDNIQDENIKENIINFFNNKYVNNKNFEKYYNFSNYKNMLNSIEEFYKLLEEKNTLDNNYFNTKYETYRKIFNSIYASFIVLFSFYIDIYLISRLFRYYNVKETQTSNIKYQKRSENIIIYTGDAHIETYVNFFEQLGTFTKTIEKVKNTNDLCLDIRNIEQPLFNNGFNIDNNYLVDDMDISSDEDDNELDILT